MKFLYIILSLLLPFVALSDENPYNNNFRSASDGNSFPLWKLTDVSGHVLLKGLNRKQEITIGSFSDLHKSTNYSGGILLNTKNYIWHPNFLQIELGGEYNPEFNEDNFIILPDRAEVRTLNKFEIKGILFSSKPVTLITFYNRGSIFQNRENLNNIKTKMKTWGGNFSYRNKILPHNITFTRSFSDQDVINSDRDYIFDNTMFEFRTSRSFTKNDDRNELAYTFNNYKTTQWNQETDSRYSQISLTDYFFLDKTKKNNLRSIITNDIRKGTSNNQNRFRVYEIIFYKLPKNLEFTGTYQYQNEKLDSSKYRTNFITATVRHQLYKSLNSGIFYEYSNIKHNYGNDIKSKKGIDIRYTKRIFPFDGKININYNFTRMYQSFTGNDVLLNISREEHLLTDGILVLLDKAYIIQSSIVVSDVTNTIIYQEGLDYLLIARNNYFEIQRVPGGLIPNNGTVYVSYLANQPGSNNYNSNIHTLSASLLFWKNLFEVYYRLNKTDHTKLFQSEYLTLNYITQNTIGAKFNYDIASGGFEFDNYNSTIIPYKLIRYYLDINKNFNNRVVLNLNANIRDYKLLENSFRNRFYDAGGKIIYRIVSQTSVSINASYLKQEYNGIDLNLFIAGAELTSVYKKLYFSLGVDFYHRKYLIEEYRLKGIYVQLSRKF